MTELLFLKSFYSMTGNKMKLLVKFYNLIDDWNSFEKVEGILKIKNGEGKLNNNKGREEGDKLSMYEMTFHGTFQAKYSKFSNSFMKWKLLYKA